MKLRILTFSLAFMGLLSAESGAANDIFKDLFRIRKNLDSICGVNKWLVQYSIYEGEISLLGYNEGEGRIFEARGTLKPGMRISEKIEMISFSSLHITISDSNGLVKSADLFGGECNSVFLTYDHYANILKKLTNYHFESKMKNCPRKYMLIEADPEIVQLADEREAHVPVSHKKLRNMETPIMGFGYHFNENGRMVIDDVLEGRVADHAGLEAGDFVTQIFFDHELIDAGNFKAEMARVDRTLLTLVVMKEDKPEVIDMYFPTTLERRIMAVPAKDVE